MNLAALMNDGEEESRNSKQRTPEMQRYSQPSVTPTANGQPPTPGYGPSPTQQRVPSYPPPSLVPQRSSGLGSQGLTPLYTAGQGVQPGQYPFPQSAGTSSAGTIPQYRIPEPPSASPAGRPQSHGYSYPQQSPLQHHMPAPGHNPPPLYSQQQHQGTLSASPTPSSHHSQHTPQSVRQSPLSVMSHAPQGIPAGSSYPSQYQQSQPSTPLGPPQLYHQRSAGIMPELTSPYHQRTFSGASNGVLSQSPAINNLVESPNAFQRPSPVHQRRTSEYLSQLRERSLSVSPKTKVVPRPPSLGSRESSVQEAGAIGRTSAQQSVGSAAGSLSNIAQHHVTQLQTGSVAPPIQQPLPNLNTASEVPQSASSFRQPSASALPHQTSIVAGEVPEVAPAVSQPPSRTDPPQIPAAFSGTPAADNMPTNPPSLKRSATSAAEQEPPTKRTKSARKYTVPPPWAIYSKHNPRYQEQQALLQRLGVQRPQQPNGLAQDSHRKPSPARPQMANGQLPNGDEKKAWQHDPPVDMDLINASKLLGKWEKSYKWNAPVSDVTRTLSDWLYIEMEQLQDVGMDPRVGTVEIEARVGLLIDTNTGERANLDVMNSTFIKPERMSRYRFESNMPSAYHQHMNETLNDAVRISCEERGRVRIKYEHLRETDSFYDLSPTGLALLPDSMKKRRSAQKPRLRQSRDNKTGDYLGRIVKLNHSNVHIFNPRDDYDCRISINLEVNLDRPDIDPNTLIALDPAKPRNPDRNKDRLSYKHLVYSIDLTKVESQGAEPTYELECEVDSKVLREQIQLLKAGQKNAFMDVVEGFLGNFTFLMREKVQPKGPG